MYVCTTCTYIIPYTCIPLIVQVYVYVICFHIHVYTSICMQILYNRSSCVHLINILQVADFPWPNKQMPELEKLVDLCRNMDSWLRADKQNILVVHCHVSSQELQKFV